MKMRSKHVFAAGVLAAMVMTCGTVLSSRAAAADLVPVGAGPKISFEEIEHDFGRILDQANVHTKFRFVNSGDETLIISSVKGSCSCTVPALDKTEYAPGESGEISVQFDPRNRRGEQRRNVTVSSNDPNNPTFTLNVVSNVRPSIDIDPPLARFGEVRRGELQTMLVDVVGADPKFEVTAANVSRGDGIEVELFPLEEIESGDETGRRYTLLVTLNGEAPVGPLQGQITLHIKNGEEAPVSRVITLMAEVVGEIKILPNRVNLGLLQPQATFERQFRLDSSTGKSFHVIGLEERPLTGPDGQPGEPQLSGMQYTVRPTEDGREDSYIMTVSGTLPEGATGVTTDVIVLTDLKDEARIPLRVTGRVRQALPQQAGLPVLPPAGPAAGPGAEQKNVPSLAPTPGRRVPGAGNGHDHD